MVWFKDNAPECDIVVSTRIRLARNLSSVPFPAKLTAQEDIDKVHNLAKQSLLVSPEFTYMHLSELSEIDRRALIEGLRTDSLYIGALRVSQVLSLGLVLLGAAWIGLIISTPGLNRRELRGASSAFLE